MKQYTTFVLFSIFCFISCKNASNQRVDCYNGINKELLRYIDSIPYCMGSDSFIVVRFTVDTFRNSIISIKNVGFVPVPPKPTEPQVQKLISEMEDFIGYKKYNNRTLLFVRYKGNTQYKNIVEPDSLTIDEKPFEENDTYNYLTGASLRRKKIELVLRIEGKDSLVLLNKENNNVYW